VEDAALVDAGFADASALAPFLPWKEGNQWTYRVTSGTDVSTKVTTIGALEVVGGTGPNSALQANRVETLKGTDKTVGWQGPLGPSVVRYREQAFSATTGALSLEEHWDPYKLHFDGTAEHTRLGASWLEDYQETKLPVGGAPQTATSRDRWTVMATGEEVSVPAGTFTALVLQKVGGSVLKTYYFARGVGKVKEQGGQLEELVSFRLEQ
jgi:hypothetical protein